MSSAAPSSYIDRRRSPSDPAPDPAMSKILERRKQAINDRQRYEGDWHLCKSYLANKQWVGWDKRQNRILNEPNPAKRERHVVNVITQYYWTMAGKFATDNLLPQLFFREDDIQSVEFAAQAQRAMEYAWYEEIEAEERIFEAILKMVGYGTAGIQCRFDATQGRYKDSMPVRDGQTIQDPEQARTYMAEQHQQGQIPQLRPSYEGKLCWEPLSPFNILPPPGIENERNFPWLILERPVPIEKIRSMYPKAAKLGEQDLSPIDTRGDVSDDSGGQAPLKGQSLLSTYYEMPNREFPKGRTVIFSQGQQLDSQQKLPYEIDGVPTIGVRILKYHRVPNRFWAVGVVEPLIGPQRERNRSRSQYIEMKDRGGLGRIYARPGSMEIGQMPEGKVMEVIYVRQGHDFPQETMGAGVGPWLADDVKMHDTDMDKVAGTGEVSLGSTPAGVSAYSAMALLAEQDDRRVGPILKHVRQEIAQLVKLTIEDIRKYWPSNKQIALAGQNHLIEAFTFNSSQLPVDILVQVGQGAPVPKNQAAEVQKIFDIFDRAISSGSPLPIKWLYDSLAAGKALPLPDSPNDVQGRLAENENMLMSRGIPLQTHPSDDPAVHIAVHDTALAAAQLVPGMEPFVQILQEHVQEHEAAMQQQSAAGANVPAMQGPMGAQGGAPPGTPAGNVGSVGVSPAFVNRLSPMPGNIQA